MRVLVTGGAGYIGSHTARLLKNSGYEPIILDNLINGNRELISKLNLPLIIGDIGDKNLLKKIISGHHPFLNDKKPIKAILHFAAITNVRDSIRSPLNYYMNNIMQSLNLLDVICDLSFCENLNLNSPIPIIFSSSCATYGLPKKLPIDELHEQIPISPYGESKLFIEKVLKDLSISHGLTSFILRYFNVAGASQDSIIGELRKEETHLIPLAIKAAINPELVFKIYGNNYDTLDGTCIRDFIHVEDIALAHLLALNNLFNKDFVNKFNFYNVGSSKGFSVKEILSTVERITNSSINIKEYPRREGDPPKLFASNQKIINQLKWSQKYLSIEKIITDSFLWEKKLSKNYN